MGTISEIKEIPEKYKKYRDKIIELFKQNDINSISSLVAMYKANPQFKENWKKIWVEVSKEDGGKISLTTVGVIIGSALGGIGVATMGSAIGGRRQKLSATPDLSGTVLPLCLIPNSALKSAPPFKSVVPKASACAGLPA